MHDYNPFLVNVRAVTHYMCWVQHKRVRVNTITIDHVKPTIKLGKIYFCDILFKKGNRCGHTFFTGTINAVEESTHPAPSKNDPSNNDTETRS